MEAYYQVVNNLPLWLRPALAEIPSQRASTIQEIRLRSGGPVLLVTEEAVLTVAPGLSLTQSQLEDVLFVLCGGSLYAHEAEIAQGFLLLAGGHRVGIGGKYIQMDNGQLVLQKVQSLNIRIARFDVGLLPAELTHILQTSFSALLIAGEPGSGKTTLLRNMVRFFSAKKTLCAVIDERGEIVPPGESGFSGCDCIQGLNKITAIEMALRTLAPRVLLVDELVSLEETKLLEVGAHTGANLVITMHASSLQELEQKVQVQYLLDRKILRYACVLSGRIAPGQVKEVRSYC